MNANEATDATVEQGPRPLSFWISLALVAAGVLVYVWFVNARRGEPIGTTGPAIGRHLAYLELEGLTGDAAPVTLKDLEGRVTLLNYWGTWCPPCLREFPHLVDLHERFAARDDFRMYAVSCGQEADRELDELRETTAKFLAARGNPFPAYADQNGASRQAMVILLGSEMAYPTTLVLDRQGIIRGFWQGYHPRAIEEMNELVERLLEDDGNEPQRHEGTKEEDEHEQ